MESVMTRAELQAVIERIRQMAASATIEWWGEELSAMILVEGSSAVADDTVESLLLRAHNALRGDRSTAAAAGTTCAPALSGRSGHWIRN